MGLHYGLYTHIADLEWFHRALEELCRLKADAARAAGEEQALLDMLWQEEQAARAAAAEAAQEAKRRHMQQEMRAANEAMLKLRVCCFTVLTLGT